MRLYSVRIVNDYNLVADRLINDPKRREGIEGLNNAECPFALPSPTPSSLDHRPNFASHPK
jgi:hypothetical protein